MGFLSSFRRRLAYALAPELLAARTLAEFAHEYVATGHRNQVEEIRSRDRGIARLTRRLARQEKAIVQMMATVEAAQDLFDNRMGYTSAPGPWAPPEFFIALGTALYGKDDDRVLTMQALKDAKAYEVVPPEKVNVVDHVSSYPDPFVIDPAPPPTIDTVDEWSPRPSAPPAFVSQEVPRILSVEDDVIRPRPTPLEWPPRIEVEGMPAPTPAQVNDEDELPVDSGNVPF